jgi:F0F1-type ATP synthase assembly protein I
MLSPSRVWRVTPLANKPTNDTGSDSSDSPASGGSSNTSSQFATAMELPLVIVGAVLLGGVVGYFIDRALHTSPWLMLVFGGLGFFGGIRDVIRRTSSKL